MILYDSKLAPNPRRVRIFVTEKNLEIPTISVDILAGENLRPEYRLVNPRGLLPTLKLDDGTCIDETVAICRYFEETCPEPNLMGMNPLEKAAIESWQRHMEFDGMLAVGEAFRNSFPAFKDRGLAGVPYMVKAIPELAERGADSVQRFYGQLERRLEESQFVAGARFTIADITALCVVDFAEFANLPVPEGNIQTKHWHAAVSARPSAAA
jgi:glutathione S-transferase